MDNLIMRNGQSVPLKDIPEFTPDEFRSVILKKIGNGLRISALFGMPENAFKINNI